MESKMKTRQFLDDMTALIRPDEKYDQLAAYELVKTKILQHL